eukprot:TRINITY_DN3096_c5_g1_i1.p1 TRINITY_DN3096_c5_g1~~TRINITY_DN3096_c5_g1_i1.p1  ORF type:complete len:206 (+),score=27.24 TRINITY_DN3096_c5_g1_i1:47-619(+)
MEPKSFEFGWTSGGVIDWIGKGYGTKPWKNPSVTRDVVVTCSSVQSGKEHEFVDRTLSNQTLVTKNEPFSWIQAELPVAVCPTHYRMSHRANDTRGLLRNWAFCASVDGKDWRVLCQHTNDQTLTSTNHDTLTGAWEVRMPKEEYYHLFRVVIYEEGNSENTNTLAGCCFELFGLVRHRAWSSNVKVTVG